MTFLPIVDRELRVASRHQFTYWSRPVAASMLLMVFTVLVMFLTFANGVGIGAGYFTFTALKWMAFIYSCCIGVFLTSDSLSEEKRDGTLGLLFLTDLRGYDVVMGKLISQSLLAFYALVAAFPVLGLPLMLGGVTGTVFGGALLIICNTVFLSLAMGMFVSSISREVTKAMSLTFVLMGVFLVGLPWLDLWIAHWDESKFECFLSLASPGHLFAIAEYMSPGDFWQQLGIQHAAAWFFLGMACVCVPHAWKEKTKSTTGLHRKLVSWWLSGSQRRRIKLRRKLLLPNPIRWLAARERGLSKLIFIVMMLPACELAYNIFYYWNSKNYEFQAFGFGGVILLLLLALWIPARASGFLLEARRNGAMELILVTPATPQQVVQGQWRILWRTFLIPVVFLVGMISINEIHSFIVLKKNMNGYTAAQIHSIATDEIVSVIMFGEYILMNALALAWFGMLMGMTSRKISMAVLKTICVVCVVPYLMEIILLSCLELFIEVYMRKYWSWNFPQWIIPLLVAFADFSKNVFLVLWSRWWILKKFRDRATMEHQTGPKLWLRRIPPGIAPPPRAVTL